MAGRHTPAHPTHLPSISGDALLAAAALARVRVLPLYVAHVCLSLRQTTDDIEVAGLTRDDGFLRDDGVLLVLIVLRDDGQTADDIEETAVAR